MRRFSGPLATLKTRTPGMVAVFAEMLVAYLGIASFSRLFDLAPPHLGDFDIAVFSIIVAIYTATLTVQVTRQKKHSQTNPNMG